MLFASIAQVFDRLHSVESAIPTTKPCRRVWWGLGDWCPTTWIWGGEPYLLFMGGQWIKGSDI